MFNSSESVIVISLVLVAVGILLWGYNRAKPYGQLGILAWLQSVVLMIPWLVFFGFFVLGIYLNLAAIIGLLVVSVGIYIYLGNRLRTEGQKQIRDRQPSEKFDLETLPPPNAATTEAEPSQSESPSILPIPEDDLKQIQSIFGIDTFFATQTIPYQEGAIFKGNLRSQPNEAHQRLSHKLEQQLGDKYRLFLVENPEGKPVVIVLPSSNDPQNATLAQKNLAVVLLVATIATSLEAASLLLGFDWFSELNRVNEALPIAAGLWSILIAHEVGHWLLARRHHIKISWPYLIPSWQIGSFGAITRFESLIPNRSVLFDIAIAGPALGGLISLVLLIIGLILSQPGSLFQLPTTFFQGSVLVGTLAKTILGDALQNSIVDIHPLTIIGWLGLVITALNLMPAGQLDGGRIVQAIYGRKTARRTTIATLVVLGIVAIFIPSNPIPLYWGIIILFLQRDLERPSLNELTEPDDARAAWGLLALFLMLATLIPLNPALAGSLGIGG
ncbi:MAG: site-2 protease family protein [Jaaginema sp. PMC 1079.18]|nr:site-2 protease family protein [Jaaginema sp. PMC 1080.18]MEC4853812.1 site-2 protease family protein [Jaaginema sp. PMC 1079.18]MEC4868110.1 site-2 protease family protein [Jaaginema sp. PMC 1078.18]